MEREQIKRDRGRRRKKEMSGRGGEEIEVGIRKRGLKRVEEKVKTKRESCNKKEMYEKKMRMKVKENTEKLEDGGEKKGKT